MTKSEFVHGVESYIPKSVVFFYRRTKRYYFWRKQRIYNCFLIKKLKRKETPINVAFLVNYASIWKYDSVFRLMQKDKMFHPFILVCPNVLVSKEYMMESLQLALDTFMGRGFETYSLYDLRCNKYISLKNFSPDILFYTRNYAHEIDRQYDVYHTTNYLKCYVNYGFNNVPYFWGTASAFHGLMWKFFVECEENKRLALSFEPTELRNAVITGYPMYDEFQTATPDSDVWKNSDKKFKRIIWAPHHTIEGHTGMLQLSTFLLYSDYMLQLAEKYKNTVQFAFKPHPVLRDVLYKHSQWGKDRTDEYYSKWAKGENTSCVTGSYVGLFLSSDAMIHDCGSFTIEYMYVNKPCMYLATYDRAGQGNKVAQDAFSAHYHGYSAKDIDDFISNVVISGNDTKEQTRLDFFSRVLLPPNGCSVAENIVSCIKNELKN